MHSRVTIFIYSFFSSFSRNVKIRGSTEKSHAYNLILIFMNKGGDINKWAPPFQGGGGGFMNNVCFFLDKLVVDLWNITS